MRDGEEEHRVSRGGVEHILEHEPELGVGNIFISGKDRRRPGMSRLELESDGHTWVGRKSRISLHRLVSTHAVISCVKKEHFMSSTKYLHGLKNWVLSV